MQQEKKKKKSILRKHGHISLEQPHVNQGYGELKALSPGDSYQTCLVERCLRCNICWEKWN